MQATIVYNDSTTNPTTVTVEVLGFHSNSTGSHYVTVTEDGTNNDVINLLDVKTIDFKED